MNDYWFKQTVDQPLFSDLLWSKPENKRLAGKLLIIGGNAHGFSVPVSAYSEALKAGAGVVRVLLPDSTKKMIGHVFEDVNFSPSTNSGGFSKQSLAELMDLATWSDGVFLAGEIGNNSESYILFESFIDKYAGPILISNDTVNLVTSFSTKLLNRPTTVVITDITKLQKLTAKLQLPTTIKHDMALMNLVSSLHELTQQKKIILVIEHDKHIFVADNGLVSTTECKPLAADWQTKLGAHSSVWAIQNKNKLFEALSCAVLAYQQ